MPQKAFIPDDCGIIPDVHCAGNDLCNGADITFSARMVIHPLVNQHINQCDDIDLLVDQKKFVHGRVNLPVLFQIKVVLTDGIRNQIQGFRVYQNGAEEGLLRNQRKGNFFYYSAVLLPWCVCLIW